jgi:multidrug efflux system membrane fusion protein
MPIKRSHIFIAFVVLVVAGWFVIRGVLGGGDKAKAEPPKKDEIQAVQAISSPDVVRPNLVTIRGRTEGPRSVQVRAETAGTVASTPTREGAFVRRGQVLCRLAVDARQASLDQARATLRSKELQYKAAQELKARGFRSETQVLASKAELDQATAQVEQARVLLEQVNIRAPFSGVFDNRDAEIGAYLAPGQPCGTVVELDPILVVGDVSESEAGAIHVGAHATARLSNGQTISGVVRFIARQADPQTRTYRVEVAARNPGGVIRSGLSAELQVEAGQVAAHLVPVTALVLDANGRQGVCFVQAGERVGFAPVQVIEETPNGVWIAGLTGQTRVITVGQSYVSEGEKVKVTLR